MKLRPIQVECYAGGRADERPRRVIVGGREHIVARLLGASLEEALESGEQVRRYTVLTVEGLVLKVIRSQSGDWYLESETL